MSYTVKVTSQFKKSYKLAVKRECHIQPDWLLIYLKQESILTLTLVDTGTHSDLFRK